MLRTVPGMSYIHMSTISTVVVMADCTCGFVREFVLTISSYTGLVVLREQRI